MATTFECFNPRCHLAEDHYPAPCVFDLDPPARDMIFLGTLETGAILGLIGRAADDARDDNTSRVTLLKGFTSSERTNVLYEGVQIGWYTTRNDKFEGHYVRLGKIARFAGEFPTADAAVLGVLSGFAL